MNRESTMPYKSKESQLACQRRYYAKHREKVIKAVQEQKQKYKAEWVEFKKTLKCQKCGYNKHHNALDFHHKDPKEKDRAVSYFVARKLFKKAMEETKKCMVLCANCHRVLHYKEEEKRKKKLAQSKKCSKIE